jgi:pimeloyl-ACP methyl ester carboxylesterase
MDPKTQYARSGEVHIAYQAVGEGPDLIFVPGWISNVEVVWEFPPLARFLRRLASFSRLLLIDKRGCGLSDPLPTGRSPSLEERMDDVRAVMDAAGSEKAALLGVSEGGALNILFAATYPERTSALALYGTFATLGRAEDYAWGFVPETVESNIRQFEQGWGSGVTLPYLAPSLAKDESLQPLWGRYERLSASPGTAAALLRMSMQIDVRHVLPAVRVPTLVLHRDERFVPIGNGQYLADHIPGARFVQLSGDDHLYCAGEIDEFLDEVEHFVTGQLAHDDPDRVLTTLLFTDIAESTKLAADLGERRWRDLLDTHDGLVRRQLERFRGRAVKTTGDGFLASFDGPARAVRCAGAIVEGARHLGVAVRAGLHTGECEVRGADLGGLAVHIGARVAGIAAPGEVLVSSTVKDLVAGSGLNFTDRGVHELKGVPSQWQLLALER